MAPTTGPSPGGKRRKRNVSPGRTSVSPERPDDGAVALLRGSRDRALELLDQAARFNLEIPSPPTPAELTPGSGTASNCGVRRWVYLRCRPEPPI